MAFLNFLACGPLVLYINFVNTLMMQFFLYPTLLLSGQHDQENIMRRTNLMTLCVVIVLDLAWVNIHPQPVSQPVVTIAAFVATTAHGIHLLSAFGLSTLIPYDFNIACLLQVLTNMSWIFVSQLGTVYVVSHRRSPARFQILAWITVMVLGCLVTLFPVIREQRLLIICVAVAPRAVVALLIGLSRSDSCADAQGRSASEQSVKNEGTMVAFSSAFKFTIFACNGTIGESLNDMATDLQIRTALSAGDTKLTLAYNCAVLLSMFGGLAFETMTSGTGARCVFAGVWGACQIFRGLGMQYLSPERLWLIFGFVFFDKFSGPLGQAAVDTALLALLHPADKEPMKANTRGIPSTAIWTVRTAAERLERPSCQLLLLMFGAAHAPCWLPLTFSMISVAFVIFILQYGTAHSKAD